MIRWNALDEVPADLPATAVTLGVFDGVHRGHQQMIDHVVARAAALELMPVAVTFDPVPLAVLRPELAPPLLTTVARRVELLGEQGLAAALVLPFTRELSALPAEEFAEHVLFERLRARAVVVGENFRFGHRAAGDVALLRRLGAARGVEVEGVALAGEGERVWSSTTVRELVAAGDVEGAAQVLGRPHRVEGVVVAGDRRGRGLGYPTANVAVEGLAVPADGVYAGWLLASSYGRLPAAVSVGTNPTFGGLERRVEAYVLDRTDLELYGEHVAVDVTHRLRDTLRFDSVDALLGQMAHDVDRARELTAADR